MFKHSLTLLAASFAVMSLAGCELYFGSDQHGDGDRWTYCGSDGYYECTGNDCYWTSSTCPSGSGSGSSGNGYDCQDNSDCAAGCYCQDGVCEEGGFCMTDADCGPGYTCDVERSSCEPTGTTQCGADSDCATGQYCDAMSKTCTDSCTCASDADAKAGGFDYCDESRGTCMTGTDPSGDCAGDVTCNLGRPSCPEGQVALIANGCYTGQCEAIASCGTAPGCDAYTHEADCQNAMCSLSYTGIGCHTPDNSPCTAGSSQCTCTSYKFATCDDSASPRVVVHFNGLVFDASGMGLVLKH